MTKVVIKSWVKVQSKEKVRATVYDLSKVLGQNHIGYILILRIEKRIL